MVRAASIGKDGKKKGAWSPEEDEKLRASVETLQKYGHNWNWHELPKWSEIAARLPGRSDNEVKNHWYTHIKKRPQKYETAFEIPKKQSKKTKNELAPKDVANSVNSLPQLIFESSSPTSPTLSFGQLSSSILEEPKERSKQTCELAPKDVANSLPHPIFESSSPPSPILTFGELSPLSCDRAPLRNRNWIAEDGISSSSELMFSEPIGNFWTEPFLVDLFDRQNEYPFNLAEERSMSPDPDYFHFDFFFYQALQDFLEN
ncbi:hypothetical protein Vadar_021922 [Vaccinium darrowii]|uniref:Uncharacterized protein n=1 Tax=Vaccinium darrowii TaxID=229202 RepID=A0ACB7Z5H6_9ERIC|nr:hypothetical protein Vadar_021922 [Vaccinium darrowii]